MFRNNLFYHTPFENLDNGFKTSVSFNWRHILFKGHFPERPVVPGVLLMQIVKECCENYFGIETNIKNADLKFLKPVTPAILSSIDIAILFSIENHHNYKIHSTGYVKEQIFFKINIGLEKKDDVDA